MSEELEQRQLAARAKFVQRLAELMGEPVASVQTEAVPEVQVPEQVKRAATRRKPKRRVVK